MEEARTEGSERRHGGRARFAGLRLDVAAALSRPIAALLLVQLLGGLTLSPTRTFLPLYITDLGHPAFLVGLVVTVQQVMGLIASWIGGALSDSLGRKRTLLLGQIGALASAASFAVGSPAPIISLRALGGLAGGLHTVAAQSYLLDMAGAAQLGLLSALFNWGYTVGGAVSSPMAGWVLGRWGYGALALGLALCGLLAVALNLWRLPALRPSGPAAQRASLGGYRDLLGRAPMRILAMLRFLPTFYWGIATVTIPLLLRDAGADVMGIALYATLSQVLAALAQAAAGRAADRVSLKGATLMVVSALWLSIVGLGLLPRSLWGVFAFGALSTAAAWSLSVLMPSLVARVAAAHERGRALGWVHLWWNLGMVLGALAGGALVGWRSGAPFWLAGVANLATLALAARFFRPQSEVAAAE